MTIGGGVFGNREFDGKKSYDGYSLVLVGFMYDFDILSILSSDFV